MALFIRDDMTTSAPEIRKIFLLQIPAPDAPVINGNTVITERGEGRLVLTSLSEDAIIEGVGGEGKHHYINGMECLALGNHMIITGNESKVAADRGDGHWGRVEISLPTGEKDGSLLNVLYVTDAGSTKSAPSIEKIAGEGVTGATFGSVIALFALCREKESAALSFTLNKSGKVYLTGLAAGDWNVSADGKAVGTYSSTEEGGMILFEAPEGKISVIRA